MDFWLERFCLGYKLEPAYSEGCSCDPPAFALQLLYKLRVPNPDRFVVLRQAFEDGHSVEELFQLTKIDRWWLEQMKEVHDQTVCGSTGVVNWLEVLRLSSQCGHGVEV